MTHRSGPSGPGPSLFAHQRGKGGGSCGDDKERGARAAPDRGGRRLVRVPRGDEGAVSSAVQGGRALGVGPAQPAPARDQDKASKASAGPSGLAPKLRKATGEPRGPPVLSVRPQSWALRRQAADFASCDTHLPKALRSLAFLPYFARNAGAPMEPRSVLQDLAAFTVFTCCC